MCGAGPRFRPDLIIIAQRDVLFDFIILGESLKILSYSSHLFYFNILNAVQKKPFIKTVLKLKIQVNANYLTKYQRIYYYVRNRTKHDFS